MNSKDDFNYRKNLAEGFLKEAEQDLNLERYRSCIDNSQLAVENAAKSVIVLFAPLEKTHTPEEKLKLLLEQIRDEKIKIEIKNLLPLLEKLGFREHILSDYGDEEKGILPWELFNQQDAEEAIEVARKTVDLAKGIARLVGVE